MTRIIQVLLTLAALAYTVAPPFVDFGATHALHPDWTGHARFHMVWLVITNSLMGFLALYQIWWRAEQGGLILGGLISLFVLGGFMLAGLFMPLYDGALTDAGGVEAGPAGIDANLFLFSIALTLNVIAMVWALKKPQHSEGVN
ncbi:MAG: hypothetical protein AAGE37_01280 [Pseudomonadota bacterium]